MRITKKVRFSVSVGRLVAGGAEREIRRAAFVNGLDIDVERHMGLLGGVLLCTVTGEANTVDAYLKATNEWGSR